ncbi:5-oxoprolinase subunit PxpB [Aureibacillus halotolerans]|uniref:KipI family sensor histidine kinase inhibitor n=1 Tax=Aureibacillus halotolerans TaxID=1508390 RepID=A0A4R6TZJ4_9BACI|nr:5-oxoprolinase subunit PxpB [Aureibacillus halotolerans]TDQ38786.1 KipI family sensor histidine kinase inhibitor [Aureibacillus halotolerans]
MKTQPILLQPDGDHSLLLTVREKDTETRFQLLQALASTLRNQPLAGLQEIVSGYDTLMIHYDASFLSYEEIAHDVNAFTETMMHSMPGPSQRGKHVDIPVLYGGDNGPDLAHVAFYASLSPKEVIELHTAPLYQVRFIGFLPGFPYVDGLPPELHVPRHETPRPSVSPGSVGIGGAQTGIYPLESPGGWNIIGQTALPLFSPSLPVPFPLNAGDTLSFVSIDEKLHNILLTSQDPWSTFVDYVEKGVYDIGYSKNN